MARIFWMTGMRTCVGVAVTALMMFFVLAPVFAAVSGASQALIVSNSPEELDAPGLVFDRSIDVPALRIVYHHKNVANSALTIQILLKNYGSDSATISLIEGLAGPDKDGVFVGHKATEAFFGALAAGRHASVILAPKGRYLLLAHKIKPGCVSSGIIQLGVESTGNVWAEMRVVDADYAQIAGRGDGAGAYSCNYFLEPEKTVSLNFTGSPPVSEIRVGAEPFWKDESGQFALKGNYGVLYAAKIRLTNSEDTYQTVRLLFSPTGGIARGVFLIDGRLFQTSLSGKESEPQTLREFKLNPHENREVSLLTMPQPGSFYPVQIILNSHDATYDKLILNSR